MSAPKFSDAQARELYNRAHEAGVAAGEAARPRPMIVQEVDASGRVIKQYEPVMDGVCGFGWVNVRPGNSPFARWLVKNDLARKAYEGGVSVWVSQFGQSYERKVAYARAFAQVLQEAGIKSYGSGRLD